MKQDVRDLKEDIIAENKERVTMKMQSANEEKSSYRQIFKATSLFGGVQIFQILIGIVRAKFVAILLGTTGVGIMGLFNAPLQLIQSVTGLGITFSAVRDVAEAHGSGDKIRIAKTITTLRRWVKFTGVLGATVTIILAPYLSKWTFGNSDYTWAFIWLSITLLLQCLSNGQLAIIQGTRELKKLAKSTVFGSLVGLFTALPLFYFFELKGIVPSLLIASVTSLFFSWYFSRKVTVVPIKMDFKETVTEGVGMVKLGLVMTFTGILGSFTGYLLNSFISRFGGVEQVGLYNSGWSVVGQATGLVFTAMTTDYFPRLSAINKDNIKLQALVNQQAEVVMLILNPLLILLITFMPIIIRILYTPEFLPVVEFANLLLVSVLIKGLVWPVGFIFPAKGDLKTFSFIEITSLVFSVISNLLAYYLWELVGLGVSFIINYLFGIVLTIVLANKKYGFKYEKSILKRFVYAFILLSIIFIVPYVVTGIGGYFIGSSVFIITAIYSFIELDKKMGLRDMINKIIHRTR